MAISIEIQYQSIKTNAVVGFYLGIVLFNTTVLINPPPTDFNDVLI
jgi:hypothetical protein